MHERLRIGVIAPPWLTVPPGGYGGTEAVVDVLCRGLAAAGHDVTLVAHGASTCPVRVVPVLATRAALDINDALAEEQHTAAAYAILRDQDVIHDHTRIGPRHARDVDVPVVVTNHGPFDVEADERLRAYAAPNLTVVAISAEHARRAATLPVGAVVHHGIDITEMPFGDTPGPHLLFLGRMSPDKGVHHAIRYARDCGVPLVLAAKMREPGEHQYFRRHVAPALGGNVVYAGELDGAAKLAMLASARALLNPLCWPEPFGMVMIEAMACGTPVITSRLGAAPELVTPEVGRLCDDPDEFREAIAGIDRVDRAAVRAHVAANFSAERMVQRHLDVYRTAIARHRVTSGALR